MENNEGKIEKLIQDSDEGNNHAEEIKLPRERYFQTLTNYKNYINKLNCNKQLTLDYIF